MAILKVTYTKGSEQRTRYIPIESVEYFESKGDNGAGELYLTSEDEPVNVKLGDAFATWDDLIIDAYNAEYRHIIDLTGNA